MRRLFIDPARAAVLLLAALGTVAVARADWGDPPTISPSEAAAYEGRRVRVAGAVVEATAERGRAVLVVADGAGGRLDVVIAPPLIGPRPAELVERFRGREIEAEGTIDDLGGLELLVGDPENVRVQDGAVAADAAAVPAPAVAAAEEARAPAPRAAATRDEVAAAPDRPAAPAAAPNPNAAAAPEAARDSEAAAAPAPVAARGAPASAPARGEDAARPPAAAIAAAPAVAVGTGAPERPAAARPAPNAAVHAAAPPPSGAARAEPSAACDRAREAWRAAAARARAPLDALSRCLAGAAPPCRREAEALREAIAEVAAAEERLAWLCAAGADAR